MAATLMIAAGHHHSHSLSGNSSLREIRSDLGTAGGETFCGAMYAASVNSPRRAPHPVRRFLNVLWIAHLASRNMPKSPSYTMKLSNEGAQHEGPHYLVVNSSTAQIAQTNLSPESSSRVPVGSKFQSIAADSRRSYSR